MRFLRRFFLWFGIATLALIALFLLNVGVHRLLGAVMRSLRIHYSG